MEAPTAKTSGTSLVLCYLTDDWQSRVIDGPRNKGQTLYYRFGITATNHEWNLCEFRKDSPPIVRIHASRFADLAPSFKTEAGLNPFDGMQRCQLAMEKIAKLKPIFAPLCSGGPLEHAIDLAEQVDSAYQANYAIHDNVRQRFFGEASDDTEE